MILQDLKGKISTLKKVLFFIYKNYTIVAVFRDFLFLCSTAAEIYGITVFGKFIDATTQVLVEWKAFSLRHYLATDSFKYLALILLLWIVTQVCNQVRAYLYTVIYEKTWSTTQSNMIGKVAQSNLQDVEKKEFQDMLAFIPAFSIDRLISVYDNFSIVLSSFVRLVSAMVIVFGYVGPSAFLLLLFVFPETIFIHLRRKEVRGYLDESIGKLRYLNYIHGTALTISNFLELRVNNIYSYLRRRYDEEYGEYLSGYFKTLDSFYRTRIGYSILGQILKFGYVIFAFAIAIVKRLTFGTFKALYDYIDISYTSASSIVDSLSLISVNLGYIAKYFDLIEYEGFGDQYHGKVKLPKGTPVLEFKNLTFSYPDDTKTVVLKDLNMVVNPGEKVAIYGGDGSGKSTIVKILTGLYGVDEGEYLLGGVPTKELNRGVLKKKLAVVFQDFINYHFSLKENIVISGQRKNVDTLLYEEVLDVADGKKVKKDLTIDDASILGKTFPSGRELAPGYWQRLAIGRMLYRNKNIFIMDEPFTYIGDVFAEKMLTKIFDFVGKDRSLIYITRSTNLLDRFDCIYYLSKGKVVESGSWEELMKKDSRLKKDYEELTVNRKGEKR